MISLMNTTTGRVLWTRSTQHVQLREAHWSADHRAVGLETGSYILVWREGYPLLEVRFPPGNRAGLGMGNGNGVFTDMTQDYSLDYQWSVDKKRLLIRFGGSGSADIGPHGIGDLYCLKFTGRKHPRYRWILSPFKSSDYGHTVWKAAWRDNRTALYWPFVDDGTQHSQTAHLWYVP